MPIIDENTGVQKFQWSKEEDVDEIKALNEPDRTPQDNADAACLKKMESLPDPNAFLNDGEIAQIKKHAKSDGRFTWERIESWKRGEDDFRGWEKYDDDLRKTLKKMSDYGWNYNGKIYSGARIQDPEGNFPTGEYDLSEYIAATARRSVADGFADPGSKKEDGMKATVFCFDPGCKGINIAPIAGATECEIMIRPGTYNIRGHNTIPYWGSEVTEVYVAPSTRKNPANSMEGGPVVSR